MSDTNGMSEEQENGKTGSPPEQTHDDLKDTTKKYIVYDDAGWLIARVHLSSGFYNILGFLREVEDNVRKYFVNMAKQQEQKKIISPGWRGFNPFNRGK